MDAFSGRHERELERLSLSLWGLLVLRVVLLGESSQIEEVWRELVRELCRLLVARKEALQALTPRTLLRQSLAHPATD
jgi:hypothetical protein